MPTQNKRIAAYLPQEISDRFAAFKAERSLGDSQALIAILSEFLGVSQQVAQQGDSPRAELEKRVEALEERLTYLKGELLGELKSELLKELNTPSNQEGEVESGLSSGLKGELLGSSPPDQLNLLKEDRELENESLGNSVGKLPNGELAPMTGAALSARLGLGKSTVKEAKRRHKDAPARFIEWSRTKDPDGIAWDYDDDLRKYRPLASDAATSNQVNPLPEGSKRSGEG